MLIDAGAAKVRTVALRAKVPGCAACGSPYIPANVHKNTPDNAGTVNSSTDVNTDGKVWLSEETLLAGALPGLLGAVCPVTAAAAADAAAAAAEAAAPAAATRSKPATVAADNTEAAAAAKAEALALGCEGYVAVTDTDNDISSFSTATAGMRNSNSESNTGSCLFFSETPKDAWARVTSSAALLLDVRDAPQRAICSLPPASALQHKADVHIPLAALSTEQGQEALARAVIEFRDARREARAKGALAPSKGGAAEESVVIVVVCRRGVFSRTAAELIAKSALGTCTNNNNAHTTACHTVNDGRASRAVAVSLVVNMRGGLEAFAKQIDPAFPLY